MRLSLCLAKANEEEMANKNPQSKPEMPKCHWQIIRAVKQLSTRRRALFYPTGTLCGSRDIYLI
jgi:hypothetical protein